MSCRIHVSEIVSQRTWVSNNYLQKMITCPSQYLLKVHRFHLITPLCVQSAWKWVAKSVWMHFTDRSLFLAPVFFPGSVGRKRTSERELEREELSLPCTVEFDRNLA